MLLNLLSRVSKRCLATKDHILAPKLLKASIICILCTTAFAHARILDISPFDQKNIDFAYDFTRNWDWTNADWYKLVPITNTNEIALPSPFNQNSQVGLKTSSSMCQKSDGWELYIRRILEWDDAPFAVSPRDPRYDANAPDKINAGYRDNIKSVPFFILYNTASGTLRYFVYITSTIPNGDYIQGEITITPDVNPPTTGSTSISDELTKIRSIIPHTMFADAGDNSLINYKQRSFSPLKQLIVSSASARGKWLIFDVTLNYDPLISSTTIPLYIRLDLTAKTTSNLSLKGRLDGTIAQEANTQTGAKASILKEAWNVGNILYSGVKSSNQTFRSVKSQVTDFQANMSDFTSSANTLAQRETWVAKDWINPSSTASLFVRGTADLLGSTAQAVSRATSWMPPSTLAGVHALTTLGLSWANGFSTTASAPVPVKFSLAGSLDISGELVHTTSPYSINVSLSGVGAPRSGLGTEDPWVYPVYAKKYSNPPLGVFGISEPPSILFLAARDADQSGARYVSWYALASNPARNIVLNPNGGYRVESISYQIETSSGARTSFSNAYRSYPMPLAIPANGTFDVFYTHEMRSNYFTLDMYKQDVLCSAPKAVWKGSTGRKKFGGWHDPFFLEPTIRLIVTFINSNGLRYSTSFSVDAQLDPTQPTNSSAYYYDPVDTFTIQNQCNPYFSSPIGYPLKRVWKDARVKIFPTLEIQGYLANLNSAL